MKKSHLILIISWIIVLFLLLGVFLSRPSETESILRLKTHFVNICKKEQESYQRLLCLKPFFKEITTKQSTTRAMTEAKSLQDEGVIDDCHMAAHFIGEDTFNSYHQDPGKAFSSCSMGCIEGCYHGVMEAYISKSKSLRDVLASVPKFCESVAKDPLLKRQCLHGVGHGILRHKTITLPEAVRICHQFPDDYSSETCLGGVFMENMNSYMLRSENELKKSLPTICTSLTSLREKTLLYQCSAAIGEGLMFYTGHDLTRSEQLCTYLLSEYHSACTDAARDEFELNKTSNDGKAAASN